MAKQSTPAFDVPAGACDCHLHVFGPPGRFPMAPNRPYTPGPATVEDLLALHEVLRLDRVVIVQPTTYGVDNACMVDALRRLKGRARGIAVVDASVTDAALEDMDRAGVRGLRVNLAASDIAPEAARQRLQSAAARAAPLGWHVQTYAPLGLIESARELIEELPVPLVIDHFGRPRAAAGTRQPGFDSLLALVRSGKVYVKLSAPYRVSERAGYSDAEPLACALIEANADRMLWGTDWPHVEERKGGPPRRPDEVQPFREEDNGAALNRLARWAETPAVLRKILVENPAQLYRL
jgi:predicted TIM-barrel fold metal-dependent hydrolase